MRKDDYIAKFGVDAWEEKAAKAREYYKQWNKNNREKRFLYHRQYRQTHKEEISVYQQKYNQDTHYCYDYNKQYRRTPLGRARHLLRRYKVNDIKHNRECNLTADWIVKRIFSRPCVYCGSTENIGCDRVNNSIGHLTWNVQPCCGKCNRERNRKDFFTFRDKKWNERGYEGKGKTA